MCPYFPSFPSSLPPFCIPSTKAWWSTAFLLNFNIFFLLFTNREYLKSSASGELPTLCLALSPLQPPSDAEYIIKTEMQYCNESRSSRMLLDVHSDSITAWPAGHRGRVGEQEQKGRNPSSSSLPLQLQTNPPAEQRCP